MAVSATRPRQAGCGSAVGCASRSAAQTITQHRSSTQGQRSLVVNHRETGKYLQLVCGDVPVLARRTQILRLVCAAAHLRIASAAVSCRGQARVVLCSRSGAAGGPAVTVGTTVNRCGSSQLRHGPAPRQCDHAARLHDEAPEAAGRQRRGHPRIVHRRHQRVELGRADRHERCPAAAAAT